MSDITPELPSPPHGRNLGLLPRLPDNSQLFERCEADSLAVKCDKTDEEAGEAHCLHQGGG